MIDAGNVIVEILPKTAGGTVASDAAYLAALLRYVGLAGPLRATEAGIGAGGDLLEVILSWAADTMADNLRDGAPRRYAVREEVSTAVRGRILFRRLARQRPGRAFDLTVRHAPLNENNPLSTVVRWLVSEIGRRTRSLHTRSICLQLEHWLSDVPDIVPTQDELARLVLAGTEERWRPVIDLAQTLLTSQQPDPTRGGQLQAVSVLLTLHNLFEGAVRRTLRDGLAYHGMRLQPGADMLLQPAAGGHGLLRLRPDFQIGPAGMTGVTIIGDAKWKRMFADSRSPRIEEPDAYQVVAYMAALEAEAGFVVAPLPDDDPASLQILELTVTGLDRPLRLVGISLSKMIAASSDGDHLRAQLCAAVTGSPFKN